jgi:hypothetical protein
MEQNPRPSLEDFRGDYGALASMMQRSWAQNQENPLLYTEEFLRSAFEYPGTRRHLSPTLYSNETPVGFIAGFPRRVLWRGQALSIALNTFLTAAPGVKGRGYGLALWSEFCRRAKREGLDGTIGFCAEGEEMNGCVLECSRVFGYCTSRILTIPYMARLIRPGAEAAPADRDTGIFLEAASAVSLPEGIARIWSSQEAEWQCLGREGAIYAAHTAGSRRGALTGYVMRIADAERTSCVIMDDILWGTLEGEERAQLLQKFLQQAGQAGAKLAVAPQMGYSDLGPLVKAGFRRTRRLMHAYLTLWGPGHPAPEPVTGAYIDVF